jgi:hypothetical protein
MNRPTDECGGDRYSRDLAPHDLYYSNDWQVLEQDALNPGTGLQNVADQYVWRLPAQAKKRI